MNKILLAITAVSALSLATFDAADAQQNRHGYRGNYGHGYNHQYRPRPYNRGNRYIQNNYSGGRGGGWNNGAAWAAGLGGLAVGAILGGALAQPSYGYAAPVVAAPVPGPNCQQIPVSTRLVPGPGGQYVQVPVYGVQCY